MEEEISLGRGNDKEQQDEEEVKLMENVDSGTLPMGESAETAVNVTGGVELSLSANRTNTSIEGSPFLGGKDQESDEEDEGEEKEEEGQEQELVGIASNEVKNIILQVLSPYFEDDGSEGGEEEDTAQRYDHVKCKDWIQLICDGILERLIGLGKPYKYVAHCMIMRKCGAGMHVCSSCFYGTADGWVSHAHDLSAHIYAVVTVYWLTI